MKMTLSILAAVFSFSVIANDMSSTTNVKIPKEFLKSKYQRLLEVQEKAEDDGSVFYDVQISGLILPVDATFGVGISSPDKLLEAEVYAGIRAIRLVNDVKNRVHIPYGSRVRVALNKERTLYAEYQYQEIEDFGDSEGRNDLKNLFSIVKLSKDRKTYWGCGVGRSVHHAWADETHAPEKGTEISCKVGLRR